jgi:AraC-like DNA-binding protein
MPLGKGFHYLPVHRDDIRRELYVTAVGYSTYLAGERYPSSGHPDEYNFTWHDGRSMGDFAVILVEDGIGEFEDQAMGRVCWRKGDVLFLPSGSWHRYRPLRTSQWTENWFCANGDYLHRLRSKGFFPRTALIRQLKDIKPCKRALDRLRTAATTNSLLLAALAMEVFAHALEDNEVSHRGFDRKSTGNHTVDQAVEFIWLNCHRSLNVASLSCECGVSRRTLERQFSTVHKRTISEEINWCRIQRAQLMLAEGDMSVKEIGYATGFGGAKRLSNVFRRFLHQTPSEYRNSVRGSSIAP